MIEEQIILCLIFFENFSMLILASNFVVCNPTCKLLYEEQLKSDNFSGKLPEYCQSLVLNVNIFIYDVFQSSKAETKAGF